MNYFNNTWKIIAHYKCISCKSSSTAAHRDMINHGTLCILPTCSRARIQTFISYTSFVSGAIITENTFGSTSRIRVTLIFWQASANSVITLSVWPTWWRVTRVWGNWFWGWRRFWVAISKWITSIARWTSTYWSMVDNAALSTGTTRSWARIVTFLSHTSFISGTFWIYRTFRSTIWRTTHIVW